MVKDIRNLNGDLVCKYYYGADFQVISIKKGDYVTHLHIRNGKMDVFNKILD